MFRPSMRHLAILSLALGMAPAVAAQQRGAAPASLDVDGQRFELRWSNGAQFEYTPKGEEDLQRWTRMVTLQHVPAVRDAPGLRQYTQALSAQFRTIGRVIVDDCLPSIPTGEECRAVAVLRAPGVSEFVVNRTVLIDGRAVNASIARRIYGADADARQLAYAKSAAGTTTALAAMQWPVPVAQVPDSAHVAPITRNAEAPADLFVDGVRFRHVHAAASDHHWVPANESHDIFTQEVQLSWLPATMKASDLGPLSDDVAAQMQQSGVMLDNACTDAPVPECQVVGVQAAKGTLDIVVQRMALVGGRAVAATLIKRMYGENLAERMRDYIKSADGQRQLKAWRAWPIAVAALPARVL